MISQHDIAVLLFFKTVWLFYLYSIGFHFEKIYRRRADNMTFTVDFCWECGNAAVTAEHLVPEHPPEWIRMCLSDLGHCSTATQTPSLSKTSIFSETTSKQKAKGHKRADLVLLLLLVLFIYFTNKLKSISFFKILYLFKWSHGLLCVLKMQKLPVQA